MPMIRIISTLALLLATCGIARASTPRLVVQLVVSSMRAEDLDRYAANFSDDGFLRLVRSGTRYTSGRYDYQQTTTPVSLATLTTGAQPSTHGVIALHWRDYVENEAVDLIRDKEGISPRQLIAPTLGEALLRDSPESRVVTVAAEPESAARAAPSGSTTSAATGPPPHGTTPCSPSGSRSSTASGSTSPTSRSTGTACSTATVTATGAPSTSCSSPARARSSARPAPAN